MAIRCKSDVPRFEDSELEHSDLLVKVVLLRRHAFTYAAEKDCGPIAMMAFRRRRDGDDAAAPLASASANRSSYASV